jgi:hypothetical protein
MQNTEENTVFTAEAAVEPLVLCKASFREQRFMLHEMFCCTVANAPHDESDNFTAKKLQPFYLALCEVLENLRHVPFIEEENLQNSYNYM